MYIALAERFLDLPDFLAVYLNNSLDSYSLLLDILIWQKKLAERLEELKFLLLYFKENTNTNNNHTTPVVNGTDEQRCDKLNLTKRDINQITIHVLNDVHAYFSYLVDADNVLCVLNFITIMILFSMTDCAHIAPRQ